jgi:tetratricopeptide (TPR) repeat protein
LKQNGLRAFQRNDFTAAIKDWSRVDRKAEPMVGPALAEAHFRRALNAADPNQRLADLMQAVELAPNEGRFWYHLGLAYHRAGRLEEARTAYGRAAATGFNRRPLIFARGLVEVEANPRVDAATLNAVTGGDTAALLPIAALLRREPQAVLAPAAANWFERLKGQIRGDAMAALWRGLALLATDRPADAATTLNARSGSPLSGDAEAVRAFYRGLALAAVGDQAAALAEWSALPERAGSPRLQAAGAAVHLGQVRAAWQAGRWAELLQAVESAFKLAGPSAGQPELIAAALVSHGRLAAEAAGRGAWAEAIPHWQQMVDLLDLVPALGPRGPIYHNLAIAYEATEQWEPAAAMWVLLMNALPRRQAKTKGKSGKSAEVDPKKSADAPADRVAAGCAAASWTVTKRQAGSIRPSLTTARRSRQNRMTSTCAWNWRMLCWQMSRRSPAATNCGASWSVTPLTRRRGPGWPNCSRCAGNSGRPSGFGAKPWTPTPTTSRPAGAWPSCCASAVITSSSSAVTPRRAIFTPRPSS